MVNWYALSLGAVAMLFVTPVIALDLMRSYELALVNDPVFRAVTMEYRAGLENKNIGRSAVLPKVAANYNTATNRAIQSGQQFPGGPSISRDWNYPSDFAAMQLTQPLFSLEALARMKQGAAQAELSKSRFLYGTQDLLIRVSQAYVDVLFANDQLRLQRAERDAFLEQSKVAERLFMRGEGSRTNVLEAQSAYQVSEARIVDATDALENARMKLEAIVGDNVREAGSMAVLKREFPFLVMAPNDFQAWREKALSSNAELKAMQDQIKIASQEYQRSNAGHYPVVNLVAAITTQSSNTVSSINQTTNQNYLGVQVSLPIFSGGETAGKSAQAYANYQKAKADFEVKKNEVSIELRKQFDLVRSGAIKIRALNAAQEYSTLLVESMRKNVLSGEKINLDVLLAQKNLFLTSRDLAQSQYGYLLAYLRLHQLGGSLEPSDFMKIAVYFKSK